MTIKELKNNNELLKHITVDLDIDLDFLDENTEVVFEVYAFGYDKNYEIVDSTICLFNYTEPNEAIKFAKQVVLADVIDMVPYNPPDYAVVGRVSHITVEVETVVEIDGECVNIGTIYNRGIWR